MTLLVLAVDPGTERTGYAWKLVQRPGVSPTLNKGIIRKARLEDWLLNGWQQWTALPHDKFFVICEDYIQRPGLETKWIKQGTAKIFGAVFMRSLQDGATFIPARPDTLMVGAALAGIKWSGKSHLKDDLSAESHAAYFCAHGIPKNLRGWLD